MSDMVLSSNGGNLDLGNGGYKCTLDMTDKRNKLIVMKALNAATSLKDVDGTFTINGIVTTPGIRSQSGAACTNVYLIKTDGSAYFSQSDGIARSVDWLCVLFTREEIADGIDICVKSIPLDNGRTLKTLEPVI